MKKLLEDDRVDAIGGRVLNGLYGIQLLGASLLLVALSLFFGLVVSKLLGAAGLIVAVALAVIGVKSLFSKQRLSDMDPDSGIEIHF